MVAWVVKSVLSPAIEVRKVVHRGCIGQAWTLLSLLGKGPELKVFAVSEKHITEMPVDTVLIGCRLVTPLHQLQIHTHTEVPHGRTLS